MERLARLSLRNRAFILLLTLTAMVFGGMATVTTERELLPPLDVPMVMVSAEYAGATPEVVEEEVTTPLEEAVRGVAGVTDYNATSSTGTSMVMAEFDYDDGTEEVVRSVQLGVDQAEAALPEDVEPQVMSFGTDDVPVVMLAVSATDDNEQELVDPLNNQLIPELEGIDGVRAVEMMGERESSVMVTPDPDELEEHELNLSELAQALESSGVVSPGGELTEDGEELTVTTGERLESVDEVQDLWIQPAGGAAAEPDAAPEAEELDAGQPEPGQEPAQAEAPEPVQLSELAEVDTELAEETSITRTDGERSLGIMVTETPDGNTVNISEAVQETVAEVEPTLNADAEVSVVFDQAPFIDDSIEAMGQEGAMGLTAAVLVILAFLLSIRSTLVTAISIPVSLLVAMIGLQTFGYSLNMLTLAALTISIGRLVDDSIVILENIKRHMSYGEDRMTAVYTGVREVATAVSSSTFATMAVFLPIAFVGGEVGELFQPFAVTVSIAFGASLLVALTAVPVLAYWFMPRPQIEAEDAERVRTEELRRELRTPMQRVYVPVIRWATRWRWTTLAAGLIILLGTVSLVPLLQTSFLDDTGDNTVNLTQELEQGTTLEEADDEAQLVEDELEGLAWVESYQASIDSEEMGAMGAGGAVTTQFTITTDPDEDQAELREKLRHVLDGIDTDTEISMQDPSAVGAEVAVDVRAETLDTLQDATAEVEDAVADVDGLADVASDLDAELPELRVQVDREAAAEEGLSEAEIGAAVNEAFDGDEVGSVTIDETEQDLVVRAEDHPPESVSELEEMELDTAAGETLELSEVAEVAEATEPPELTRSAGLRVATVEATLTAADLGAVTTEIEDQIAELDLPEEATAEIGGVSADQEEAFTQLILAMLAAVLISYLIMVATFKSLVQPLILLVSIPFAATGSIGLLLLTNTTLDLTSMVGLLMLIGIVVTNAIVLIDLVNQYRQAGMGLSEAVVEGGRHRLRPIVMTALATIGALTPMAIGVTGGGAFVSQGLALVTIGGLVSSTMLTLVLVPVLYTMIERRKERMAQRREQRRARKSTTAETTTGSD